MCEKSIKNSQPFGKKISKTSGGIFFTHTVCYPIIWVVKTIQSSRKAFEITQHITRTMLSLAMKHCYIKNNEEPEQTRTQWQYLH